MKELKSLKHHWTHFEASVLPDGVCDSHRFMAKASFFAGFTAMLKMLAEAPETEKEFMAMLRSVHGEAVDFKAEAAYEAIDRLFDSAMASKH